MKILAIDDQQLVLYPLKRQLTNLGFEIKTLVSSVEAIKVYETFLPDLVIVDMNMPTISGLDIIRYIREQKGDQIPILVLSGNTSEKLIIDSLKLGVYEYLRKPINIDELSAAVIKILGCPKENVKRSKIPTIIEKSCVGLVVPCHNVEDILINENFIDFIDTHSGFHLCFINDGSTDDTLNILYQLRKGRENHITICNYKTSVGKTEAIRLGMLYMAEFEDLNFVGFTYPEMLMDFSNFKELITEIENSDVNIVSSFYQNSVQKERLSSIINLMSYKTLGVKLNNVKSATSIMKRELVSCIFKRKFTCKKFFDYEIYLRLKQKFGKREMSNIIAEYSVNQSLESEKQNLTIKENIKVLIQLAEIIWDSRSPKEENDMTLI
ncbi:Glycosyl transferase family 2 [Pustulibacterium marinum]|uniref:Glycosyl transferase family 2 n=1 Tax=Pustulibacterium marinum TaxID=1224947 RepID=A0A1I7HVX1_9FLAO|nr:response regulator [Pustulibacterium marinum]SFU64875.1 Glycosyl transferase family 2 [Pustulibacterium marinum]